jgi:transcriptional regulator with XRE-family HTH domain
MGTNDSNSDHDDVRHWIQDALEVSGLSVAELARRASVSKSTVFRALSDDYQFIPSHRTLLKLAAAAGVALPKSAPTPNSPHSLPVVRYITPDFAQDEDAIFDVASEGAKSNILPSHRAPADQQWVGRLLGDSLNEIFAEGTLLHFLEYRATTSEVFQRRKLFLLTRRDGTRIEYSVAAMLELEAARTRALMRYPSKSSRWQSSFWLDYSPGTTPTYLIAGVLIGAYVPDPELPWR